NARRVVAYLSLSRGSHLHLDLMMEGDLFGAEHGDPERQRDGDRGPAGDLGQPSRHLPWRVAAHRWQLHGVQEAPYPESERGGDLRRDVPRHDAGGDHDATRY